MTTQDQHAELPTEPDLRGATGGPSPHADPLLLAVVAAGGFLGAPARYAIAQALPTAAGSWPWDTFLTNIAGAFLLGLLLELLARGGPDAGRRRLLRLLLGTGFLGAFTTYSTLAVEADLLVRAGRLPLAAAYAIASVAAGTLAAWSGIAIGAKRR